jgi:hypothetical protein
MTASGRSVHRKSPAKVSLDFEGTDGRNHGHASTTQQPSPSPYARQERRLPDGSDIAWRLLASEEPFFSDHSRLARSSRCSKRDRTGMVSWGRARPGLRGRRCSGGESCWTVTIGNH